MTPSALLRKVLDALAALEGTGAEVLLYLGPGVESVERVRELARLTGEPVESHYHAGVTSDSTIFETIRLTGPGTEQSRPVAKVMAWRPVTREDRDRVRSLSRKDWYARLEANAAQNAARAENGI